MATTIGSLDLASLKNLRDDLTQYFWFESSASATYGAGVHVTLVPDTTFISNPTGQNILMNTDGISIRNGLLPMMTLSNNSLDFNVVNTTAGTYTKTATFGSTGATIGQTSGAHIQISSSGFNVNTNSSTNIASFGTNGARIGKNNAAHSIIDANGQRFYATNGTTQLANIGYGEGTPESGTTPVTAPYYDFGIRKSGTTKGNYSVAEGVNSTASGYASHAEGYSTASMLCCHSEGNSTADGYMAHSEGTGISSGYYTHAEGCDTVASGWHAHAQNTGTKASSASQTAIGKYNIEDTNDKYAFIIGNGSDNAPSNALAVEWNGYVYTAKDVKITTVTNIISVNATNATITSANYVRRGNVAQIRIVWTNKSAISVGESGNITNIQVGTLVSGKRPLIPTGAWSVGDNAGAAWYNIGTDGVITLGACEARKAAYTIAAGSTFWACSTFLVD